VGGCARVNCLRQEGRRIGVEPKHHLARPALDGCGESVGEVGRSSRS
jgi:hypothetical protein